MAQLTLEQKNQRDNELKDVREVLNTEAGQRFLWRILSECGIFRVSFDSMNSNYTVYNEGRRSIGLFILNELNEADYKIFSKMQQQAILKHKEARAQKERELEKRMMKINGGILYEQ